jgi:hypothetical protein
MRITSSRLIVAVLAVAALLLAGCGDSGVPESEKLPADTSQTILGELEGIDNRVASGFAGACDDIFEGVEGGNFDTIDSALADIPDSVDADIRSALEESIDRLKQLVDQECEQIRSDEEQTTTEEADTTDTTPTETETVETVTIPETDTETETTPTEPVTPPSEGNGRGPDGTGPPGQQDGGGIEAPSGDDE